MSPPSITATILCYCPLSAFFCQNLSWRIRYILTLLSVTLILLIRGFLWPFLVTSKSYIVSLKSGIKVYRNSYKASIKSRPHMARITVSTIKDKRENIKHQFSQRLLLQRAFVYEILSLIFTYHELASDFNNLNAKIFIKEAIWSLVWCVLISCWTLKRWSLCMCKII